MQNPRTNGKMLDRRDKLHEVSTDWDVPCTLDWSSGYFFKSGILPTELEPQTDDLKNREAEGVAKKLREEREDESHDIEQRMQGLQVKIIELVPTHPTDFV